MRISQSSGVILGAIAVFALYTISKAKGITSALGFPTGTSMVPSGESFAQVGVTIDGRYEVTMLGFGTPVKIGSRWVPAGTLITEKPSGTEFFAT